MLLHDLPTGNAVFAILRLKEVTRQMPGLLEQAVDELGGYGAVGPLPPR